MGKKSLSESDRWALMSAFALIIILLLNGQSLYKSVSNIVMRQQMITDNLRRWVASYRALQPVETEWREKLKSASELDLLAIYQAIGPESAGLASDADMMLVDKIDRVVFSGVEPGASTVHVITAGKPGFIVTAPSWHALINGLQTLAYRRDIQMQAITMEASKDDAPTAIIHDLAIVLRDDEAKKMNKTKVSAPALIAVLVTMLWAAHWATQTLSMRMARLPIEGTQHAAHAASITPNTKIYPLLAETQARSESLEAENMELAFTRALAPPVIPPPQVEQPKPSAADVFKQHARVTAIAATGAFINGRYYQVGESINTVTRLVSVRGCTVQISVGAETVKLHGNCKGS